MPGKVNPVMAEALNMVAFQVAGNDHTVSMATQAGQMELNVMMPVINHNILNSMEILKNGLLLFSLRCVDGITANKAVCRDYAEKTVGLATVLNLHVGYSQAAEISKRAVRENKTIRELVLEEGLLSKEAIDPSFYGGHDTGRKEKKWTNGVVRFAVLFMTLKKVIPIVALQRGRPLRISPMTGIAPSVKSIKVDSSK
jgi:aspartate ammonia-lyase